MRRRVTALLRGGARERTEVFSPLGEKPESAVLCDDSLALKIIVYMEISDLGQALGGITMSNCDICPRQCGANRDIERGYCGADSSIRIARAAKHMWEEPIICGKGGSGTIFFSGCSLGCEFCQNALLSHENYGTKVTVDRLYEIMFELESQGAVNINLVTADHYIPYIIPALKSAKDDGLKIPLLLNTSSYLKIPTLKMLDGIIDIYLADLKFTSRDAAMKYCSAPDYPKIARTAIEHMVKTSNNPIIENGIMKKGVIVRVLVLPGNIIDAKASIKYLYTKYGDDIYISIMGQYVPMPGCSHHELQHELSAKMYKSVVRYASGLGIKNGFIQDLNSADRCYIPEFNCQGVKKSC